VRTRLRQSLFTILDQRGDQISPRRHDLIVGLYEDWLWLDERIETVTRDIELISESEANCARLKTIPGVGPLISTALVAAIGTGEAFERGRDFGAWLGLIPGSAAPAADQFWDVSPSGAASIFIQAANVILMRPHNWEKYSFGPWLKQAEPRMHRNSSRPRWPTSWRISSRTSVAMAKNGRSVTSGRLRNRSGVLDIPGA
jgi:transposase